MLHSHLDRQPTELEGVGVHWQHGLVHLGAPLGHPDGHDFHWASLRIQRVEGAAGVTPSRVVELLGLDAAVGLGLHGQGAEGDTAQELDDGFAGVFSGTRILVSDRDQPSHQPCDQQEESQPSESVFAESERWRE